MKKLSVFLALLMAACSSNSPKSTPDAATTTPPPVDDCFTGTPQTHDQLINACVDKAVVTRIIKHPTLPLLNPDGSLPPPP